MLALSILTNPYFKNGMKPGDEVIVPALSWSTSIWPIIQYGLKPVFVDINKETMNIDTKLIEGAITKKQDVFWLFILMEILVRSMI